jgi:cyclopropane fatty-acyl-phospholipid synthase-like methyltransferase
MGAAIQDFFYKRRVKKLRILSSMFDEDEMPISHLFRQESEMSPIEQEALRLCRGKVLDIGAGAGAHSRILQNRTDITVTAIDISPGSVQVMRSRGIKDARIADFFIDDVGRNYDTLLLMMNGIGIVGQVERLEEFFKRADELLTPKGCIILDSSDIIYIYDDQHLLNDTITQTSRYYGQVDYTMHYGQIHGLPFDWLYLDPKLLEREAAKYGYTTEIVSQGEHYDYLARLTRV